MHNLISIISYFTACLLHLGRVSAAYAVVAGAYAVVAGGCDWPIQ